MSPTDVVVLGTLLAFAAWGAMRGPLRQLISLLLVGLALVLATPCARHATALVEKVSGLGPDETRALAWGLCFFLILVGGGLLVAATRRWTAAVGCGGGLGRALGALLGAAKGAVLLLIVGYALLAWPAADAGSSITLRRDSEAGDTAAGSRPPWRDAAKRSRAAEWLVRGGDALRGVVVLPTWVDATMDQVDADVRRAR